MQVRQYDVRHIEFDTLQTVASILGIDNFILTGSGEESAHEATVDLRVVNDKYCPHK